MFRVRSLLSPLPCPIEDCSSSFCPYNHIPLGDSSKPDPEDRLYELAVERAGLEYPLARACYDAPAPDIQLPLNIKQEAGAAKTAAKKTPTPAVYIKRERQERQPVVEPVPEPPKPTHVPFELLSNPEGDIKPYLPDLQRQAAEIRNKKRKLSAQDVPRESAPPPSKSKSAKENTPPAPAFPIIKNEPNSDDNEETPNMDMTINTSSRLEMEKYKSRIEKYRNRKTAETNAVEKKNGEKAKVKSKTAEKEKLRQAEKEVKRKPSKDKSNGTKEKIAKTSKKEKEESVKRREKKRSRDDNLSTSLEKKRKKSSTVDEYVPEPVSREVVHDMEYTPGVPSSSSTPAKSILKKSSANEKVRKLSSATESYVERHKREKAEKLKAEVDFSKRKIASAASEDSAQLLRPSTSKPKPRDVNQDMHRRFAEPEPVREAPSSRMGTEYNPVEKNARIAHAVAQCAFRCVPIKGCKVPMQIRQTNLEKVKAALHEKVHPNNETIAKQVALELEREHATKATTRGGFINAMCLRIAQIKKATIGDERFQPKHDLTKIQTIPMNQALADKKVSARIAIKPKTQRYTKLSGERLYRAMSTYLLKPDELWIHGYPIPKNGSKKIVEVNPDVVKRYKKLVTNHPTKRKCCRCQAEFEVNVDEGWVSEGECFYHSGKLYPTRTSHEYSCCHGASNSDACKFSERHVHEENRLDFTGYDRLAALKKVNDNQGRKRAPGVFALDCEMVYTVIGFELARVTIIDDRMDLVLDAFCKPRGAILDYNEKYSGVTEKDLRNVTSDLREVQKKVRYYVSEEDILVGHSLDSDLKALKIHHKRCVDTSAVYPHKKGLPYKRGLKTLMREECGKMIQEETADGAYGHDSSEDAKAALQLMFKKLEEDQKCGKFADDE